jgi:WD40 repeat protein
MFFSVTALLFGVVLGCARRGAADDPKPPHVDYQQHIAPLFVKYCTACHNADDPQGKLVLESYDGLLAGGAHGSVVTPGKGADSRLIRMVSGAAKPSMPPKDSEKPTPQEIGLLRTWIDAGAVGPTGAAPAERTLVTPKIPLQTPAHATIGGLSCSADAKLLAIARGRDVELISLAGRVNATASDQLARTLSAPVVVHRLTGHVGAVKAIAMSSDGARLAAAGGEPGLFGETKLWNTQSGKLVATFRGHRDAMYSVALSRDGALLATGGYDQNVIVWDVATGKEKYTIAGHTGAVFGLAFSPNGKLLASASADRTVKLWNVTTGARLDTFAQPLKDVLCVAFSPDGRTLAAGGVDRRIRVWSIDPAGREGANLLLFSRFAHEGPVMRLAYSSDGRTMVSADDSGTVKIWGTQEMTPRRALAEQSDWAGNLTLLPIAPGRSMLVTARRDGKLASLAVETSPAGDAHPVAANIERANPPAAVSETPAAPPVAVAEVEPNDTVAAAQAVDSAHPTTVTAKLMSTRAGTADVDLYKFTATRGEKFILETNAARQSSPCDTKIEVLDAAGAPIVQTLLQAVRDSAVTFRGADAVQTGFRITNWEEMELDQYLYVGGEVCRLFRFPQGPDSDFVFYEANGRRRAYFQTTATAHYLDEPCYIVRPLAPGSSATPTGLPTFPVYYVNDDDSDRRWGTDSRLAFTAPASGTYLARVSDTRGFGGEKFAYQLTLRHPAPDFVLSIGDRNPTVNAGSAKRFTVRAERIDGFDGEIRVDLSGAAPPGFTISAPLVIAAGHSEARGMIAAAADAPAPTKANASLTRFTATATIDGRAVTHSADGLGEIKLAAKPKLVVRLEPDLPVRAATAPAASTGNVVALRAPDPDVAANATKHEPDEPPSVTIVPGTTVTARLVIERNGFAGEVKFDVDNLPHGVIVDNIGLNGILIPADRSERQIFLSARPWVAAQSRPFQAVALAEGNQASRPMVLVVKPK